MTYTRLSKEQLEELHPEFIKFLATQSIDADEWTKLKKEKPEVAEAEIDVFSDMIWEGVLNKVTHLEHFSKDQIHLFYLATEKMHLIAVKVKNPEIDLLSESGYGWLQDNLMDDAVSFFNATKEYNADKNLDKFNLIKEGAQITKGNLYSYFAKLLDQKNK